MKLYFCPNCNGENPTLQEHYAVPGRGGDGRLEWKRSHGRRRICLVCRKPVMPKRSKYGAKPAMGTTGKLRHSSSEAAYEGQLAWMQKLGEIEDLRLCNDVPRETYELEVYGTRSVDALLENLEWLLDGQELTQQLLLQLAMQVRAVRTSKVKLGTYTPDFSYRHKGSGPDGHRHVVDTKGYETADFSLKRKLLRACHGIDVELVKVPRHLLKTVRRSA